jgi:hypothetical protein
LPQFFAYGTSGHGGAEHNCSAGRQKRVVLAALSACADEWGLGLGLWLGFDTAFKQVLVLLRWVAGWTIEIILVSCGLF